MVRQISGAEALMQFALVLTGTFCILSVVLFLNWMVHYLLHKGNLKTRMTFSLRFSPSQATFSFISIKKKKCHQSTYTLQWHLNQPHSSEQLFFPCFHCIPSCSLAWDSCSPISFRRASNKARCVLRTYISVPTVSWGCLVICLSTPSQCIIEWALHCTWLQVSKDVSVPLSRDYAVFSHWKFGYNCCSAVFFFPHKLILSQVSLLERFVYFLKGLKGAPF